MKDSLSSFLPQLPGVIDTPGVQDNSSLRGLYEKPPGMCMLIPQLVIPNLTFYTFLQFVERNYIL